VVSGAGFAGQVVAVVVACGMGFFGSAGRWPASWVDRVAQYSVASCCLSCCRAMARWLMAFFSAGSISAAVRPWVVSRIPGCSRNHSARSSRMIWPFQRPSQINGCGSVAWRSSTITA
jgi:hypothetical protein